MHELQIDFGEHATQVRIGPGSLAEVGDALTGTMAGGPNSRVLLVTDETVGELYAARVYESVREAGFTAAEHRITAGEASKSMATLGDLYGAAAQLELDRGGLMLALGGGVVSDVTGLAAATWMRGVRFAICPTTLEADVDAAIGGKTGINIPSGKNLVGAFHQPALVLIDPQCLATLPMRDISAGMAESIKHGLLSADDFLPWHEAHAEAILARENETMTELVVRNVRVKAGVVAADAREQADRRIMLNLGHTIGHAIETCADYELRHGECVALGLLAACRISQALGLLDPSVANRTEMLVDRFNLPMKLPRAIESERILTTMRLDKKARDGHVRFVLLEGIGRPVVRDDVPETLVGEVYESLLE